MRTKPSLTAVPLLPSQRRDRIVGFLQRHGAVTLQQIAQAIDVSVSTLRRDLDGLEAEGVLDRTHGGAILRQQHYSTFEPDPAAAAELSPREKRSIGMAAAASLQAGQTVIFDSGTTVLQAAIAVLERRISLVAVTNDLEIARLLGTNPQIRVHVPGGQLRSGSNTLIGHGVIEGAAGIRADVLLLGAHAVTAGVLSETDADVAAVKRAWMASAASRRLLVDSSKFRPRAFMSFGGIGDVHEVVTDSAAPAEETALIEQAGVQLSRVHVGA